MSIKVANGFDLQSQKIVHVADGSAADDAATYGQVLNILNGLDWKPSVRAATTANGTLATAYENGDSIDGVTLATGDRILLKNQTAGAENGIYVVAASGAPARAADADASSEVTGGLTVYVNEGTTNGDTQWTLTTNDAITLGTTALVFTQSGSTSPDTADSSGGLQKVGSAFSVKLPASSGLVKDSTGLYVDTAIVVRKYAANIGDGSTTAITVTHNLGTRDVTVCVYDSASYAEILADVAHTTTNTLTITFAVAPASNAYRVVVHA